ncbi:RodZ domain-containing protein [Vibrio hepatarius]|jgi:cytoskeleton protein RodZ|uniref:Transcriptional regulator n=1 Tax=Vibrio hepatarius TaxID=171383 RepID=A0A0M0HYL8_9VIBR|nr:RodZ domain-containing protein [Vibrio hepatarius]KOO07174.1 transcriptional regulator [Vibrio hepatarius]NOI12472.1 DUF4115 domain-containing protein [Vibrio hepatarius]
MTADKEITAPEEQTNVVQAGTLLKQKREQLGLSQKQIADRLRLRVSIIQSIESNQFASDQVATFTKGYLRSYAKAVGMDVNTVLKAYSSEEKAVEPEAQEMKSFSRKTNREKHDSRIMTLTWGIVIVIIGISSLWWWQNQETAVEDLTSSTEQEQEIEQQLSDEQLAELPAEHDFTTLEADAPLDVEPQAGVTTEEQDNTVVEAEEPMTGEEALNDSPAEEPVSAAELTSAGNTLKITFNGDCWISVKDDLGNTLSTGVKKAGQSLELAGQLPYKVILGAPENVSMTLSSEPVDLSGYTSGKVARFTLP